MSSSFKYVLYERLDNVLVVRLYTENEKGNTEIGTET
ncbi:hypothetical protein M472_00975 [Sphingobacterium paucimobilis HER1398]|uniref:Uncharacterized protein n=1 Tax=Sphingobacterium paucimobilis HER1398 TaxID=1346330 RepID=U2J3V4_9SPHI|nr:hypothetical protein M472_00975 [Sphingobacterium paucimobilis HER1398]